MNIVYFIKYIRHGIFKQNNMIYHISFKSTPSKCRSVKHKIKFPKGLSSRHLLGDADYQTNQLNIVRHALISYAYGVSEFVLYKNLEAIAPFFVGKYL